MQQNQGQGFDRRDNMGGGGNRQGGYQNHQDDHNNNNNRNNNNNNDRQDNRDRFDRGGDRFERGLSVEPRYGASGFDQEGPIQRVQYPPPSQRDNDDRNRDHRNDTWSKQSDHRQQNNSNNNNMNGNNSSNSNNNNHSHSQERSQVCRTVSFI
jgi:hypothetical protein